MGRLPDLTDAQLSIVATQSVVTEPNETLTMVKIDAQRHGRSLHNHAAFRARLRDGRIAELWMVDALPAYSDEFWS